MGSKEGELVINLLDQYAAGREVLYVGCHPHRPLPKWFTEVYTRAAFVDGLEIYPPNFLRMQKKRIFREIYLGDIRDGPPKQYDLIFWWHGPEHLPYEITQNTLNSFKCHVIAGCPYGIYEQGAEYGNPYEVHVSHLMPGTFTTIGYQTATFGAVNSKHGHIVAWR